MIPEGRDSFCKGKVWGSYPSKHPTQPISQVSLLARRRDALLKEVDDFTRQDGDEIQNPGVGWGLVGGWLGVGWVAKRSPCFEIQALATCEFESKNGWRLGSLLFEGFFSKIHEAVPF